MSAFTRYLTFHSTNLGKRATLLLTFDDQTTPGIHQGYYPTAWRVSTFGASGNYFMTATYEDQPAFIKPQVVNGVIITAGTWIPIDVGQSTNLTESGGVYSFTSPVAGGASGSFQAWNKTSSKQDISLGFVSNHQPTSTLYFPGIGVDYDVCTQFKPILRAYIFTDYQHQQDQILSRAIQLPVIWQANLATLSASSSFTLSYESSTSTYTITQDYATFDLTGELATIALLDPSDFDQVIKLLEEIVKNQTKPKQEPVIERVPMQASMEDVKV